MFLTTVRVKRCQARSAEAVLTAKQLKQLRRDPESRRIDAVSVHVAGATVAIVNVPAGATFAPRDPEGGAPPELVWKHPDLQVPGHDLIGLVKAAITLMDGAQGSVTPPAIEPPEASPASVAAERPVGRARSRGRARQVA